MKKLQYIFLIIIVCISASCKTKLEVAEEKTKNADALSKDNPDSILNKISQNDGLTDFSFNIFRKLSLKETGKNISFSPVSLNIAMGMVYGGSGNNTAVQISSVMGFLPGNEEFCKEYGEYYNYLNSFRSDTSLIFNLANRVFLDRNYLIKDDYRLLIKTFFDGAFENADFRNNYKAEETHINNWVSEMTKKRINNLIPEGTLNDKTKMVLVNAIYIKSEWKYPFRETATKNKDFYSMANQSVKTDFMIQRNKDFRYADFDGKQILELPYKSSELSLIIILPHNSDAGNISSFIPDNEDYVSICKQLKYNDVYVEIPRFKTESSFKLADIMKGMGIKDAFDSSADFSGITDNNDLAISEIIQKVFFEINEKGSETAAATAVIMYQTSAAHNPQLNQYVSFIANRPFIYIIKENRFNTPLFIGQYVKP